MFSRGIWWITLLLVRGLHSSNLLFSFCNPLGQKSVVLGLVLFLGLEMALLEREQMTATLETFWRNQPLDLGAMGNRSGKGGGQPRNEHVRLEIRPGILLLRALNLSSHNILPDVILLRQVEELSDLGRPLGTKALGEGDVGQPGNIIITLFDDDNGQNGNIGADDASTDGFALALTIPSSTVTGMAVGKEKTDTVWDKYTLLHWETLFVVTTSDTENVALPFVTD